MKTRRSFLYLLLLCFAVCGCSSTSETNIKIPDGYLPEKSDTMCFDEGDFEQLYNYCPTVMVDGYEAHVYYCTSMISNKLGGDDRIGYRHGIKKNGVWYWGPKILALDKGEEGSWDSSCVCDPDVIKGEFVYDEETYYYLMTYLGTSTEGNYENAYGFAVSKEPAGPWIRVNNLCPLYDFWQLNPDYEYKGPESPDSLWGWGQSCLVSYDKKGQVLVFDTGRSATGQTTELWDFSNLNDPKMIWSSPMSNKGIYDLNGQLDSICNAHVVYDQKLKCFYMLSNNHPYDDTPPTNLSTELRITMINDFGSDNMGDCFKKQDATWVNIGSITPEITGFPKNSNSCFERDPYGWMINPNGNSIDILYSAILPEAATSHNWIFTFRIYRFKFDF